MVNLYKDLNCYLYEAWCEAAKKMDFKLTNTTNKDYVPVVKIDNKYINNHFFNMLWTPYNKLYPAIINSTVEDNCLQAFNSELQSGDDYTYHLEMSWNGNTSNNLDITDAERDAYYEVSYALFPKLDWSRQNNGLVTADDIASAWCIMLDPKQTKEALEVASFNQTIGFVNE